MKSLLTLVFIFCLLISSGIAKAEDIEWNQVGPQNLNKMIYSMTYSKDGSVLIGTTGSGLFKSTNKGQTWEHKVLGDIDHDNGMVTALYSHPSGKLFAGQSNGMTFLSTDNGSTWNAIVNFSSNDPTVVSICDDIDGNVYILYRTGEIKIVKPNGDNVKSIYEVYFQSILWSIAVDSNKNIYVSTMEEGIYKSSNQGESWTQINTSLPSLDIHKVFVASNGDLLAGLSGTGGIFKSTNGGDSWIAVLNNYPDQIIMDIKSSNDNTLFATSTNNVFMSTNNGTDWESIKSNIPTGNSLTRITIDNNNYLYVGSSQGKVFRTKNPIKVDDKFLSISVEPMETQTIAPGKSIDYSIEIKNFENNPVANATINIEDAVNKSAPKLTTDSQGKVIYKLTAPLSVQNALYEIKFTASKDSYNNSETLIRKVKIQNEDSWAKVASYDKNQRILSIITSGQENILLGVSGGSFYGSTNSGNSWFLANNSISMINSPRKMVLASDKTIFAATDWDGLLKTTNMGMSWTIINTGFEGISNVALGETGTIFVCDLAGKTKRSINDGSSWEDMANYPTAIKSVADIIAINQNVFIAAAADGLFVSNDNGSSWNKAGGALDGINVISLAKDNEGNIIAGTKSKGIYVSKDFGSTWMAKNSGISDFEVHHIFANKNQYFALCFGKGIWYSSNSGDNWIEFNQGLESLSFKDLYSFALSDDGNLYSGAFDKGLYKRKNPSASAVEDEKVRIVSDLHIYPNPISDWANVSYSIENPTFLTITIQNSFGELIATVVNNEFVDSGNYTNAIETTSLLPGVYFFTIKTGLSSETKKFVVVK